ncbi:hypothetical protein AVHY2522_23515 [Acidovorax sp. SUPP2522]|uniref:hypothetical protein n=1 Tax=unclassified Acidovorax TaxID=2684926 RepID=UPI0023497408|nr:MULTISPECIES: hypothetical protein [unclassified Acidovorax]WCM96692.1 hypothetical protein M5C96_20045 [Acidovorax sp. GBBC 1281]GKT19723.1 hypothetical protein AVHY2522_23515 [Acidovorax sp. SUPP2522]
MHDDFHPPVSSAQRLRPWPIVIGSVVIAVQLVALGWVVQGQVQQASERQAHWAPRGLQSSPATYAAVDAPSFSEPQP